jgi:hypothetical protein
VKKIESTMLMPLNLEAALILLRRAIHCLRPRHHAVTKTAGMPDTDTFRVTWLGCSCGKVFDTE